MNAIELLEQQHREAEALLNRSGSATGAEQATALDELAAALRIHTAIEERLLYPALRDAGVESVEDAFDDHANIRESVEALAARHDEGIEFDDALEQLRADVLRHVRFEENTLFPAARDTLEGELDDLGDALAALAAELEKSDVSEKLTDEQADLRV